MKTHTQTYKENLITLGKEIDAKITYTINGTTTELDGDSLASVTPHFKGNILKSVMKQVDIVSDIDIPLETQINVQFGMKYDDESFEYINFGNYIVYSSEKQEDTNNYRIVAYDKMLYAMKDYEELDITYPCTIKQFLIKLSIDMGLGASLPSTFVNQDRELQSDVFKDLGYTKRDVLDQLAEVTASTICISNEDALQIRYLQDNINATNTASGNDLTLQADDEILLGLELLGDTTQETTNGNQLVNFSSNSGISSNTTYSFTNDLLTITSTSGTYTSVNYDITSIVKANPSKVLKFSYSSVDLSGNTSSNTRISQLVVVNNGSTSYHWLAEKDTNTSLRLNTYTIPSTTTNITSARIFFYTNNSSTSLTSTSITKITKPLVYLDNNSTYEPYTNGASPNPSYPQPIETITGRQEINVVGKNLFGGFTYSRTNGGVVFTHNEDGTIEASGTATGNPSSSIANATVSSNGWYKTIQPGTYTLSGGISGNLRVEVYDSSGTRLAQSGVTSATFTTTEEKQVYIRVAITNGYEVNNVFYAQLEKGNTATDFEEYKGKSYEINLGKNLLNITSVSGQSYGNSLPSGANANMVIDSYDTNNVSFHTTSASFLIALLPTIQLEPNTKYTISYTRTNSLVSGASARRYIYNVNNSNTYSVNTSLTSGDSGNMSYTFTTDSIGKIAVAFGFNSSSSGSSSEVKNIMIEKGSTKTDYAPYFTPIELCKIGDYQDKIFKGKGINLLDISTAESGKYYADSQINNSANWLIQQVPVKSNTNYYLSGNNRNNNTAKIWLLDENKNRISTIGGYYETHLITTTSTTKYIGVSIANYSDDSDLGTIMINEGTTILSYEPYNAKDKWLLRKEIGKIKLTNVTYDSSYNRAYANLSTGLGGDIILPSNNDEIAKLMANYFTCYSRNTFLGSTTLEGMALTPTGTFSIRITGLSSSSDYTTWLSNNQTYLYYVLATPTVSEITNSELIKQLNKPKLLMGLNNITSDSPLNIEYVSEYETIDENYIKNNRVDFGEKYGPVNSIVLSRSADSDNIYLKDQESIDENGLCEIKIKNNQVMNDNDRSDYLPEILSQLNGLSYYINDFESIGITYLDLCDKYKVKIGDTKYPCVMFNDEVEIKNGLNEIIYTDKPEISQTDYRKASESDKAERQTYLIVDKQAQRIDAVVSTQEEFDESLSQLTIDVDGIQTKVELNYDFVREVEHSNNVSSEEMQKEGLIQLSIKGTAISSNYLRLNISNNTQSYVDLPITTILYQDEDTHDELIIENVYNEETDSYEYHTFITKKLDYIDNAIVQRSTSNNYLLDETTTPLTTESGEELLLEDFHLEKQDLGVIDLTIDDGEHTFSINGYNNLDYYLKYIIVNNITSDLVQSRHIISEINQSAEEIQINADKVSLNGKEINLTGDDIVIKSNNFNVDKEGNVSCNNAVMNDINIKSGHLELNNEGYDESIRLGQLDDGSSLYMGGNFIQGWGPDYSQGGELIATPSFNLQTQYYNHETIGGMLTLYGFNEPSIELDGLAGSISASNFYCQASWVDGNSGIIGGTISCHKDDTEDTYINGGDITCRSVTQTSIEEAKKNFEKLSNALDIVENVDIYKYNFRFEKDKDKKHIGFVIGDNFKYRREITNSKNDGAEIYSMISVLWKAVQEQQEQIEELKKEIGILKGGK